MYAFVSPFNVAGCSGGFRNLERGVQPLVREAHPKIVGLPRLLPSHGCIHDTHNYTHSVRTQRANACTDVQRATYDYRSELNISKQL